MSPFTFYLKPAEGFSAMTSSYSDLGKRSSIGIELFSMYSVLYMGISSTNLTVIH